MAAPAAASRRSDPAPDGPARSHARRHGADPGHAEPSERSAPRQEGAEHGDGAAIAGPLPRAGRPAAAAAQEGADPTCNQTSGGLTAVICTPAGRDEGEP